MAPNLIHMRCLLKMWSDQRQSMVSEAQFYNVIKTFLVMMNYLKHNLVLLKCLLFSVSHIGLFFFFQIDGADFDSFQGIMTYRMTSDWKKQTR